MKTIAIVNQKGGVGKTTTAVTLAHGLARRGYYTLLIDLDAQGNVADALGLDKRGGLYDLLVSKAGRRAITRNVRPQLDAVLGDKTTVEAKQILAGKPFRERALAGALAGLGDYDVCILDVAPGVDLLQIGALVSSTHFMIPVSLSALAVVGVGDALATAASLRELDVLQAHFLGVLPTFWERTTNEGHEQLKGLVAQFNSLVWPPIPVDVKAREAPAYGQTLWEYAPRSRAVVGVKNGNGRSMGGYEAVLARLISEVCDG